ncbi:hypothetical protein ACXYTP_21445 [Tsukamurella ocularis]
MDRINTPYTLHYVTADGTAHRAAITGFFLDPTSRLLTYVSVEDGGLPRYAYGVTAAWIVQWE